MHTGLPRRRRTFRHTVADDDGDAVEATASEASSPSSAFLSLTLALYLC
jgi:hypothetical protein